MEHIQLEAGEDLRHSALWDPYFADRSVCVIDIETTGLDRSRNCFILGGLYDPQEHMVHQIFAERRSEETAALTAFLELVRRFDAVVTYNGRHFDLPFLEERARRCGVASQGETKGCGRCYDGYDLDLYQVVNAHSPLRRLLPNLRQKTVEDYMGLWSDRSDEISGAESVELYAHYEATADADARRRILLHNSDDVLQLTRLVKVIGKTDFHRAMHCLGFPVGSPRRRWQTTQIRLVRDRLCIQGLQGSEPVEYRGFHVGTFPIQTAFHAKAGSFQVDIPVLNRASITAMDLEAAGLPLQEFEKYPGFGSGFLVLEDRNGVQYREVNHLVRVLMDRIEETLL